MSLKIEFEEGLYYRQTLFDKAKRVVVKVGSAVLADKTGLNRHVLQNLAREISFLHNSGREVILVTSGAVAAGKRKLQYSDSKALSMPEKQALAAIGQSCLMHDYDEAFARNKKNIAQIDPYAGRLTIFRVFRGVLEGDTFYNSSKKTSERFGQLYVLEGKEQKPVEKAGPGMIIAVAKLKETGTGDTLCDSTDPILLDAPEPLKPVISFAVSAKKGEEEKVFSSITKMLDEDRSFPISTSFFPGQGS